MRTQIRIVSGSLRGRKIICNVNDAMRPTPQRVREALFSLLGNAVPERRFYDVFAGTGIVGFEAISRGASSTTFVERDHRLLADLQKRAGEFGVEDRSLMARTDAYRWAERWEPPREPVNIFISPPFVDFTKKPESLLEMVGHFQERIAENSIIVLQGEHEAPLDGLPHRAQWEDRKYGRNHLLIWIKESEEPEAPEEEEIIEP